MHPFDEAQADGAERVALAKIVADSELVILYQLVQLMDRLSVTQATRAINYLDDRFVQSVTFAPSQVDDASSYDE